MTRTWLAVCAGAPALVLSAALATVLIGEPPMWSGGALTVSEAAALRDQAAVVRLVSHGVDPNAPASVRAPILGRLEVRMTPLEAATAAGHVRVLELLVSLGAVVHQGNYASLWCLAEGRDDVRAFIESRNPGNDVPPDCTNAPAR
jgi:ankyrin repeat protein